MKSLILSNLLSLILITSCSTTPEKKKITSAKDVKPEDFKAAKVIPYRASDDIYSNAKGKKSDVSNSESLQRLFLYDGDIELEGELGKIATLCYEKKFDQAFKLVKFYNKQYLKNPIFWNQVGTCYLLKGERRKALLFYNKSLSHKSNYAPALNNLGVMYFTEGDYSRALVAFEKAKESKTFSRTPRFNLANLKLNFGLYEGAIEELKVLHNLSSTDVDVNNMLGTAYLMSNNPKEARRYFIRIPDSEKEHAKFGINAALAEYNLGNKEAAEDIFEDINEKNLGAWKEYYEEIKKVIIN